ncbi:hypothetical protein [Nitratifractor sp.]|uniref:YceD family protein n=1 Tax=Nitratifractor sp. TaxID=2268144 RepID=UPI0025DED051|nr:hypothetical protein [Nitratifractor sp.]
MKISFNKVGRSPGEFCLKAETLEMAGTLLREGSHEVKLSSTIAGEITLICDRCGAEFTEALHLPLNLTLTDQPRKVTEDLDTIEFLDGVIDIAALMEGEIASYRSAYHYCPACREAGSDVDIEY